MISEKVLFRVVRGTLRNVSHAHATWGLDPRAVQSISKRLAGTLRSLGVGLAFSEVKNVQDGATPSEQKLRSFGPKEKRRKKPQRLVSRQLLRFLGTEARAARSAKNKERERAIVDVLRFIDGGMAE